MTRVIVGIDPGKDGALAIVDTQGVLHAVEDMPTAGWRTSGAVLAQLLKEWQDRIAMVVSEELGAVPGSGSTGAFRFGHGVGVIEGVVLGMGLPLTQVRPQVWTRELRVGSDKGQHRLAVQRLWPVHGDRFKRVKDHGRADAALLAHWWLTHGDAVPA